MGAGTGVIDGWELRLVLGLGSGFFGRVTSALNQEALSIPGPERPLLLRESCDETDVPVVVLHSVTLGAVSQ